MSDVLESAQGSQRISLELSIPQSDAEVFQALARLKFTAPYLIVLGVLWKFGGRQFVEPAITPGITYFCFGLLWYAVAKHQLLPTQLRRQLSVILDQAIFGYGYFCGGQAFALVAWGPTSASIGHGLRFGARYTYGSVAVSTLLIGISMLISPVWQPHGLLAIGILISGVALPIYTIKLSDKIARGKQSAEDLAQRLERLNRIDVLTGLLNRKGLEDQFTKCFAQRISGVLIYLDLDGFKQVNDVAGHTIGDNVLREVAAILRKCLRSSDYIARIGGDEFAILLTNLSSSDAAEIAKKIIYEISALRIDGCSNIRVTASIGAVRFPIGADNNISELLSVADLRMYEAKRAGKNRIWFPEFSEADSSAEAETQGTNLSQAGE